MKAKNNKPKLTLVGAGPGDIDLITIKGMKAIANANVILYDALVNKDLLKYAAANALKIYVGKRINNHTYTQSQINSFIVDFAFTHGHVVRLKGGDSFVFGRGFEEITYAESFNIETAVVPGISSSIAVPAIQKIPLTNRGMSESFWVITGTTCKNELSKDILLAAQSTATVIILMGINKLSEIVKVYEAQKKYSEAIAIIQNGSLENEKISLGTIDTIEEIAKQEKIKSPAIIIIGDVVKLHADFPQILADWKYLWN